MKPLVISGYGTSLRVSDRALELSNRDESRLETFGAHRLPFDSIVVDGNAGSLSFEAARFLALHDIPVVFLRWDGSVLSTLLPRGPVAGELRLAQLAAHGDQRRREAVARTILDVKLTKSVELLRFLSRFYPCDPKTVEVEVKRGSDNTIRGLLVWEAHTAEAYWVEIAKVIKRLWPESGFVSRRGKGKSWAQNATDPGNALLNFGYALLEGKVRHTINSVGLLPEIGFLHETAHSKLPLVYDLQELFRWLVDLSVIEVVASRELDRKSDFITTENYHFRLKPHVIALLSERVSENFNRAVSFEGRNRTLDAVLFEATRKIARHLFGHARKLDLDFPFAAFDGALDAEAAEAVSALTYADARKLGISKAGLWDMKRRVAEGKPLRVYRKVSRLTGNSRLRLSATAASQVMTAGFGLGPPKAASLDARRRARARDACARVSRSSYQRPMARSCGRHQVTGLPCVSL